MSQTVATLQSTVRDVECPWTPEVRQYLGWWSVTVGPRTSRLSWWPTFDEAQRFALTRTTRNKNASGDGD